MDVALMILAAIFIIAGIVGSVMPGIPGPPLGYIGILLLYFTYKTTFSLTFLIVWAVVVIVIQVLDNVIPLWSTKKLGGSKWGVNGSIIGLIVGLIFPPIGLFLGTFLGAIIGEFIYSKNFSVALKSGLGAFLGFMASTVMKLAISLIFVYYYIVQLIHIL